MPSHNLTIVALIRSLTKLTCLWIHMKCISFKIFYLAILLSKRAPVFEVYSNYQRFSFWITINYHTSFDQPKLFLWFNFTTCLFVHILHTKQTCQIHFKYYDSKIRESKHANLQMDHKIIVEEIRSRKRQDSRTWQRALASGFFCYLINLSSNSSIKRRSRSNQWSEGKMKISGLLEPKQEMELCSIFWHACHYIVLLLPNSIKYFK